MNASILGLSPTSTIILIVVAAAVVILAVTLLYRRRQSQNLKARFGAEYDRTVGDKGGVSRAEAELAERTKRVAAYNIRPLPVADREHYLDSWRWVQTNFVDSPKDAVTKADGIVGEVMTARGYPVDDFERGSADLSVDHPKVVENYRAAHDIAVRLQRGEASTEDLRQAMIHYRALFEDLVGVTDAAPTTAAA
jgi:hypothetical protein